MARLVVDPVTRIEGHLRIEAQVDGGKISDAWSAGTMFRGIELILQKRDPREAWIWAQRICGVCTMVHALASVRAVEDALQIEVPENARIVRNLIAGSQMVQDHVIHFYHLHALDWVDVTLALKADPAKTSQLAQSISDYEKSSTSLLQRRAGSSESLGRIAASSACLPAAIGDIRPITCRPKPTCWPWRITWKRWPGRRTSSGSTRCWAARIRIRRLSWWAECRPPWIPTSRSRSSIRSESGSSGTWSAERKKFVEQVYIPDVLAVAGFYKDWFTRGEGVGNFLSYGDYSSGDQNDAEHVLVPERNRLGPRSDQSPSGGPGADHRVRQPRLV